MSELINNSYYWYEIKESTTEKISYLENEVGHYINVFETEEMNTLYMIIFDFRAEIISLKNLYNELILNIERASLLKLHTWLYYKKLIQLKQRIDVVGERLKLIVYSIIDLDVKRRFEYEENIKNQLVARGICKYFLSKFNGITNIFIESYFGYESSYFWMPLTIPNKGIINAPRINHYYTRYLPICCHEISHPVIEVNNDWILQQDCFRKGLLIVSDMISSFFSLKYDNFDEEDFWYTLSQVFSEILSDIFSVIICGPAFVWSFMSSELWPENKVFANDWIDYEYFRTHPPNKARFYLCIDVLKCLKKNKDADLLENNWKSISSLQNDIPMNENIKCMNKNIDLFLDNFNTKEIVDYLIDENTYYHIKQNLTININNKNAISSNTDPIDILNALWKIRYNRFIGDPLSENRLTTKILNLLYYSLKSRSS